MVGFTECRFMLYEQSNCVVACRIKVARLINCTHCVMLNLRV